MADKKKEEQTLDAVQAHAGQERATSLRQQLALLLDGEPTGG